ncbi:polysaccharide deacetylase family protein [Candidatus Magnetominusculus dajiuhuensis]|uniref:polysaccharide deacetylase family protein n=1 Tax=Candidatus Magnetominusculus dajiuhuensis TaxID=3137712 RepID=UPI003B428DCF
MRYTRISTKIVLTAVVFLFITGSFAAASADKAVTSGTGVPILLYHRLGPTVADSMTITTPVFESHLKYLRQNGYTVIPLRQVIDCLKNNKPLPPHSVVIVADDGHKSIYTDMLPLVRKYQIPVTLFIYPSAISNASYAMTWNQLKELKETGLFDLQSHTYWHPNFKVEKKRLDKKEYEKVVETQLKKSKDKLEKEFGTKIDLLAWPFGIYDDYLSGKASEAGYVAAFSIERRPVRSGDNMMSLPRFLLENANQGKSFERLLTGN